MIEPQLTQVSIKERVNMADSTIERDSAVSGY